MLNKAIITSIILQLAGGILYFFLINNDSWYSPLSWVLMLNGLILPTMCIIASEPDNKTIPRAGLIISGIWWFIVFLITWGFVD